MRITTLVITLFCAAAATAQEVVRFRTDDGIEIVGDHYAVAMDAPTVIALPMYRNVRASWKPLAGPLRERGLNLLALDLRGHGDSAPALREKVVGRDAELFNSMHKDVDAAVRFLESKGYDGSRIGLAGASVGCSVAVQTIAKNPGPYRSAVIMTPGSKYLGVDTIADAKRWPGAPIWVLTSTEEADGVRPVAQALAERGGSELEVIPGRRIHGTRMFGAVEKIELLIADFFQRTLLPDAALTIPAFAKDDPRVDQGGFVALTRRVHRHVGDQRFTLMAFAVGDTITLGAMTKGDFQGHVRFRVGDVTFEVPFDTASKKREHPAKMKGSIDIKALGEQASFRGTHWINIELKRADLFGGQSTPLSLEFAPAKGRAVTLPAAGRFAAKIVP